MHGASGAGAGVSGYSMSLLGDGKHGRDGDALSALELAAAAGDAVGRLMADMASGFTRQRPAEKWD